MVLVPRHFGALLHNIVPREDFLLGILVDEVEGRARKLQHFGVGVLERVDHILPQFGLRALVCFVDDEQIPFGGEDVVVLFVLSAHRFRSAQVLHGGKTDDVHAFFGLSEQLGERLALGGRTVVESCRLFVVFRTAGRRCGGGLRLGRAAIIEDLFKVFVPSGIDHRTVGDDEGALGIDLAHHLKRREGFAETHLAVP